MIMEMTPRVSVPAPAVHWGQRSTSGEIVPVPLTHQPMHPIAYGHRGFCCAHAASSPAEASVLGAAPGQLHTMVILQGEGMVALPSPGPRAIDVYARVERVVAALSAYADQWHPAVMRPVGGPRLERYDAVTGLTHLILITEVCARLSDAARAFAHSVQLPFQLPRTDALWPLSMLGLDAHECPMPRTDMHHAEFASAHVVMRGQRDSTLRRSGLLPLTCAPAAAALISRIQGAIQWLNARDVFAPHFSLEDVFVLAAGDAVIGRFHRLHAAADAVERARLMALQDAAMRVAERQIRGDELLEAPAVYFDERAAGGLPLAAWAPGHSLASGVATVATMARMEPYHALTVRGAAQDESARRPTVSVALPMQPTRRSDGLTSPCFSTPRRVQNRSCSSNSGGSPPEAGAACSFHLRDQRN